MVTKRTFHSASAFTLVEVLLAAAVMLVGVIGMIHAITLGSEMLDTARKQTIATQIMHGELEKIRLTDWAEIVGLGSAQGYAEPSADRIVRWVSDSSSIPRDAFKFSRTISAIRTDLKQVSFTASWIGNTGRP